MPCRAWSLGRRRGARRSYTTAATAVGPCVNLFLT
jgi:hypothetical protein